MLSLKAAQSIAGTLGYPSKMPGTSYGISAHECKTGSKLAAIPGSVCHGCYALKGNYQYKSVATAHTKRLDGINDPQWAAAMATMLNKSGTGWHRWHDSGDLQSVAHLAKICAVARATPKIRHWLPTRELKMVQDYVAQGGIVPDNLLVRVSATMIDGKATSAWPFTSQVHSNAPSKGARECPAPRQGNKCGNCRACWSPSVKTVSYHKH